VAPSPTITRLRAVVFQIDLQHHLVDRVVLGQQDGEARQRLVGQRHRVQSRRRDGGAGRHAGQAHLEQAAGAGRALDPDLALHQFQQPLADRQAQPGAAELARGGAVGLLEGVEDT
jgi:hypothetical protein